MMKRALLTCLLALAACNNQIPHAAWQSRGGPESLLDVSTEVVNLSLESGESLDQLIEWLNEDQPTRVELYCDMTSDLCLQARDVLDHFGVGFNVYSDPNYRATLMYDRVLARDCDNRYMDNPINPYNLNHPTFGCSMSINSVQMISDKQQIAAPKLSDFQDADKMEQAVRAYNKPSPDATVYTSNSMLNGR